MWCRKSATNKDAMMANSNATSHTLSRRPSRGRSMVFTQSSSCKRSVISREYNSAFMAREFRESSLTILAWVALSTLASAQHGNSRRCGCLCKPWSLTITAKHGEVLDTVFMRPAVSDFAISRDRRSVVLISNTTPHGGDLEIIDLRKKRRTKLLSASGLFHSPRRGRQRSLCRSAYFSRRQARCLCRAQILAGRWKRCNRRWRSARHTEHRHRSHARSALNDQR